MWLVGITTVPSALHSYLHITRFVQVRADKAVRLLDHDYAVAMEFKTSRDCGGADWVGSGIWGDTVCLMKAHLSIRSLDLSGKSSKEVA